MDDSQIVDLYFARDEQAIQETDSKYGGYCYAISPGNYSIVISELEAEKKAEQPLGIHGTWSCNFTIK